jgi:Zn-dependent protease with chaperone function
MKTYSGNFYPAADREPKPATIVLLKENILIGYSDTAGLHHSETWKYGEIQYFWKPSEQKTEIKKNSRGAERLTIEHNITAELKVFTEKDQQPWLKKTVTGFRIKMFVFLGCLLAALLMLYFLLVPFLSEQLAKKLPVPYEISLGNMLFQQLADPKKVDPGKTALANEYFKSLQIDSKYPVQITVVNSPMVNAFAIMGGHIVVYTGLLQQLKNHESFAALLSHEWTHIQNRHTSRMLFRRLGSKVFLSLLFGQLGSLTDVVLQNSEQFTGLHYSRKLEKEADLEGLKLLQKKGIDTHGFSELFETLAAHAGGTVIPEILSDHPDLKARMEYIVRSPYYSNKSDPELNNRLRNIFLQLQNKKEDFSF